MPPFPGGSGALRLREALGASREPRVRPPLAPSLVRGLGVSPAPGALSVAGSGTAPAAVQMITPYFI